MKILGIAATSILAVSVTMLTGACQPEVTLYDADERTPELNLEDAKVVDPEGQSDAEVVETAVFRFDQPAPVGTFDSRNDVTIRGAVLGKKHVKLEGDHTGIVVELQPGGDFIDVLIGTTRFNHEHDVNVDIADRILVTGPVVRTEHGRLMLARELAWNDRTIKLRDADGEALWRETGKDPEKGTQNVDRENVVSE